MQIAVCIVADREKVETRHKVDAADHFEKP